MLNRKWWMVGILVIVGSLVCVGVTEAQEPALDIQPPEAAPMLEAVPGPAATNEVAVPAPVPVPEAPAPVVETPVVDPVVTNAPAVIEIPAVTPAPVVPVITNVPAEVAVVMTPAQAWKDTSWQVGTRYTEVQLEDTTRGAPGNGSYFGSITTISEEQDGVPDKLYLQYRIMKSPFWVGVSRDHVRAETLDDLTGDGVADPDSGDGSVDLSGFIPYIQAVWDNKTRLTPYVQVGYGFYQADFEENEGWGSGGMRRVDLKGDVNGLELAGGLHVRIYKNLAADIFAKSMQIDDVKGEWYSAYGRFDGGPVVLTMSYVAYGAGISYRF